MLHVEQIERAAERVVLALAHRAGRFYTPPMSKLIAMKKLERLESPKASRPAAAKPVLSVVRDPVAEKALAKMGLDLDNPRVRAALDRQAGQA